MTTTTSDFATTENAPVTFIRPSRGWVFLRLREIWEYRDLLFFLAWRDIKVRYKQTVFGAAWAILQPFLTMVVFSIFFGNLAKVPSDGIPYPVFTFAALVPWQLFANAVTQSGNSLVANQNLITKVYFPRLIIPLSTVLAGLIDFAIAFAVLLGIMFYYGMVPGFAILTLPFFVLLTVTISVAVGLWLSALNVQYRDVRYVIPFLTQFWMFATPIAYSSTLVPEKWRVLYGLNPMSGVVEGFRWALWGGERGLNSMLAVSVVIVVVLLVGGLYYFRRMEKVFADVV